MKNFKSINVVTILIFIILFISCISKNDDEVILYNLDKNEKNIGALTATDDCVYYAKYEMDDGAIFPRKTFLKKIKKGEMTSEIIYEFQKPLNVSYLKYLDGKLFMVCDDFENDYLFLYENNFLKKLENDKPMYSINPSYSGNFISWIDFDESKIKRITPDKLEVEFFKVEDLSMNKYERTFNYKNKSYIFSKNKEENLQIISIDWDKRTSDVVLEDLDEFKIKDAKPMNIGINDRFIKWEVSNRKETNIYFFNRKTRKIKKISINELGGALQYSFLLKNRIYIFNGIFESGIGIFNLDNNKYEDFTLKNEFTGSGIYHPGYPYSIKDGFVCEINDENFHNKFMVIVEKK